MPRAFVLLLLLAGCGGEGESADKDGAGGGDSGGDTSVNAEEAPYVVSVQYASCAADVDDIDRWAVAVSVGDPQGDIASVGSTVTVLDGDTELGSYVLACSSDTCSGSWSENEDGVDCTVGGGATFRFVIMDDSGNSSAPFDHQPA